MTALRVPWPDRLSVRLIAALGLMALLISAVFTYVGMRVQQKHLVDVVVRGAAMFSDTIRSSTYHHMLEDRRADAYQIMETIGRQEGIQKVRVFNKEGRITFSTDREEVGTLVDQGAESCYACHTAGQPLVRLAIPSRSRIFHARDGHRVLGMVTPIYNEPACSDAACHAHPAAKRVLGVVDIGVSLAAIDRSTREMQRATGLVAAVAVLLLATMIGWLVRRQVVRPVQHLLEGTRRVAAGDLEHVIDVQRQDEIGTLTVSFNRMTASLLKAQENIRNLMDSLERQVEERTADLRAAQNQLVQSEKMASLGKLSASIAHEINNPLSGILTTAKLLLRMANDADTTAEERERFARYLGLVERESQRCTVIVRNLLDFAKQRQLTLGPTDVNAVVREALSLLANQITIQGIRLEERLGTVPAIEADFGQLRQALVNICINACEAMGQGGTLTVSTRSLGDRLVEVAIADTGAGISPEHLNKVMEPFFSTKEKGTGLGLSVVYGIVERHGGKFEIDSQVGRGTTVRLRFPVVAAGADAPGARA